MSVTKLVRVYEEDLELLNQYLSLLQLARKKRLSFAEVVHAILDAIKNNAVSELKAELDSQQAGVTS